MDDAEANKNILRRVLKAYELGDFDPVLSLLDENVVWTSNALAGHFRFGGRREGRAGAIEALSMIATDFAIERYAVDEIIGEGDVVWASCQVEARDRRTGRTVSLALVNRWQFQNGKIVSCSEFFDTAGVLHQQGRIAAIVAPAARV
ncbi:MAG: nuclear transport factor 2 family protein [Proteobacteria bacterium]|nr:nuclear transport factor 2 family protein [Pseudomonadota bacterium]